MYLDMYNKTYRLRFIQPGLIGHATLCKRFAAPQNMYHQYHNFQQHNINNNTISYYIILGCNNLEFNQRQRLIKL